MQPIALIDIGINLTHDSYDRDRAEVIARARAAGIVAMIVTGSTLADSARAIALCAQWPGILRATAGVHPHHATGFHAPDGARLADLYADPMTVAAGECGLDYYRNYSPPAEQRRAFELQLGLAALHDMPLFLHQREAHADFLAMLREHPAVRSRAVLHCFTGDAAELEDCLGVGLSIGITGWICDERRGQALRDAVGRIPDERLMLESDGPYLLPRTLQPKPTHRRNEPMYLPIVLEAVAACRGQPPAEVAAFTTANARRFFGFRLDESPPAADDMPRKQFK
ncbi:MAG TPA: TatD family hydrolase [Steroidobacteraceae bacterium]|nr:TatD family hydrolase [Steroidobacteraceae bacterium]